MFYSVFVYLLLSLLYVCVLATISNIYPCVNLFSQKLSKSVSCLKYYALGADWHTWFVVYVLRFDFFAVVAFVLFFFHFIRLVNNKFNAFSHSLWLRLYQWLNSMCECVQIFGNIEFSLIDVFFPTFVSNFMRSELNLFFFIL